MELTIEDGNEQYLIPSMKTWKLDMLKEEQTANNYINTSSNY